MSMWNERIDKVRIYLAHGDLFGFMAEARLFWEWRLGQASFRTTPPEQSALEDVFWDRFDMQRRRETSWLNAGDLGYWAFQKMCDRRYADMLDIISEMMQVPRVQPLRGLVLGCGDMVTEHINFINPNLPFVEVDAYDVSTESIERARQLTDAKGLNVNYHVADVNQIELPPDRYALVVILHAYHHFEQVDHVAQQVNRTLLPGGVFYTWDYIGPCRLQYSERQLFYAQWMLQLLPYKYRRARQRIQSTPEEKLSPNESISSDQILAAIARHMDLGWQYNWAGLLFPLLDGISYNFTQSDEDQAFLKFLFELDYALCQAGAVEPNFTITLATKRSNQLS